MLSEEQIDATILQACGDGIDTEGYLSINAFRSVMSSLARLRFQNQACSAAVENQAEDGDSEEPELEREMVERELDMWVEHELKPAVLASGCHS